MYNRHQQELDKIFDDITGGIRIQSRCQCYEKGKKSNKFFLNLEKKRGIQGQIQKLIVNKKEISDEIRINVEIKLLSKKLVKKM